MNSFFLWLLLSATTYRLGVFIVLDGIVSEPREWFLNKLTTLDIDGRKRVLYTHEVNLWKQLPLWRRKLYELLSCARCVCTYTAAASLALPYIAGWSVPLPVAMWFAATAGGLVLWAIIDSD